MTTDREHSDGITAGWRIFSSWARENLSRSRRRRAWCVLVAGSALGSVVSSISLDLVGRLFGVENALISLFAGVAVASLVLVVWSSRWMRPGSWRRVSGEFSGTIVAYGTESKIRDAWLESREPEVKVDQRLASAESARRSRQVVPRLVVWNAFLIPFWLAGVAAAVTLQVYEALDAPTLLLLPLYAIFAIGSTLGSLHALGRTRAPIESAPAVPDGLQIDGRKTPVPRKLLGTDHPDDYT